MQGGGFCVYFTARTKAGRALSIGVATRAANSGESGGLPGPLGLAIRIPTP
jgi:hypothetical protein